MRIEGNSGSVDNSRNSEVKSQFGSRKHQAWKAYDLKSKALRIDHVSVHVRLHLPFILALPTIENVSDFKFIESQFRFVCSLFMRFRSHLKNI